LGAEFEVAAGSGDGFEKPLGYYFMKKAVKSNTTEIVIVDYYFEMNSLLPCCRLRKSELDCYSSYG
jgi:hypothetical protein